MEFNPVDYTPDGVAVFGKDEGLLVKFFKHPQISRYKSTEAGVPVYDDVTMIEVINPGEKEPVRVLKTREHEFRFRRQWDAFCKGQSQEAQSGTPLDHLFPNEPSTVLTLKGFNVFSVQQLANLHDTAINNLQFGRQLVDRAKAYLGTAEGGAQFHQMEKTIADQARALDDMQAQMAALQTQMNAPSPQAKRPGPKLKPPKITAVSAQEA
jgi:uncharacterized coiled-coil protein SlyX